MDRAGLAADAAVSLSVAIDRVLGDGRLQVDLTVPPGVTALFGPSGAGKTSVLRTVAGLARGGDVILDGRVLSGAGVHVAPHKRRIAYVFQEPRLLPHLSVRRNLTYGGRGDLDGIARLLDITPLLDRRPPTLSGGEAQRVALGRALMQRPDAFLLDEPLAALDRRLKAEILPYLERMVAQTAVPILYVSHDPEEVARLADRVALIDRGRLVAEGPFDAMFADLALAPYLGPDMLGAVLTARVVVAAGADGLGEVAVGPARLWLPGPLGAPGQEVRLRIRASDVMLALGPLTGVSALNQIPGRVVGLRPGAGPGVLVALDVGGVRLLSRVTARSAASLGLRIGAEVVAVLKSLSISRHGVGSSREGP